MQLNFTTDGKPEVIAKLNRLNKYPTIVSNREFLMNWQYLSPSVIIMLTYDNINYCNILEKLPFNLDAWECVVLLRSPKQQHLLNLQNVVVFFISWHTLTDKIMSFLFLIFSICLISLSGSSHSFSHPGSIWVWYHRLPRASIPRPNHLSTRWQRGKQHLPFHNNVKGSSGGLYVGE